MPKKKILFDVMKPIEETRRLAKLLHDSEHSLPVVAEKTGLNYFWLLRFVRGEIEDPKMSKLARIARFLEEN